MKVKFSLEKAPGNIEEEIIELDECSNDVIEFEFKEWVWNQLDAWWEIIEK